MGWKFLDELRRLQTAIDALEPHPDGTIGDILQDLIDVLIQAEEEAHHHILE